MGFAEEKVYTYIRKNMSDFYCIRVNHLIRELPCLSVADTEEITATCDRKGNEQAIWDLFLLLKCRGDWVRYFIEALRKTKQEDLADRIQDEYSAYQVCPRNNAPGPAANNSLPSNLSAQSRVPPPATNPEAPYTGAAFENNPPTASLPRQPGSIPGPGARLPHQSSPSADRSDVLRLSAESCQNQVDCNTPVQEMEPLAKQEVTEDAPTPWREALNPQSTGNIVKADLRASQESGSYGDGLATAAVKLSPGSPVKHQVPREGVEVAGPSMPVSKPSAQEQHWAGRQQHPVCVSGGYFGNMNHLNVGNSRKASSVPRESVQRGEPAAALGPEDFENQPEEVYFSSFERSPPASGADRAVPRDGPQAGDSLQQKKVQAGQGSEHGNQANSTVDVRDSFLLHNQLDTEQTREPGQGDHGRGRHGFPLLQSRDSVQSTCGYGEVGAIKGQANSSPEVRTASAFQATSSVPPDLSEDATAHDFGSLHLGTMRLTSSSEKLASGTSTGPSQGIPASGINSHWGGESGGCLADTLGDDSGSANSRDPQSKVQIPASAANILHPASTPGPGNVLPSSSPLASSPASVNRVLKLSNATLAGEYPDLSGFSSTAVIPPSSPGLPSDSSGAAFNSDLGELKRPIQESKQPEKETERSNTFRPKENVTQAPKPPSLSVTRTSSGMPVDTAGTTAREAGCDNQNVSPGPSRGCQVFYSNPDEERELSKPGVLTSIVDGGKEEPAERQPDSQETNGQYSGLSNRFFISREYSAGSTPLMISDSSTPCSSTSGSQSPQPEENHYSSLSDHHPSAARAAAIQPENISSWDSADVGTHEFQVVEYPNVDLREAASPRDVASAYENPSPACRELSGYQKSSSKKSGSPPNSEALPGGSPQRANRPRRGSDGSSFPSQDYVLAAAIAAFISVVAFLFYKHLRN